ncbi:2-acylglycerol O-acyltransferase 2-like isoform X2 [Vanessa tameamea]|uniref:2-acylglycerol O-acyltransferase 2-like isoform X2 n=1 Tax=Vanessa tameamea TaxID=334116 RepID=A0A8B8HHJ9_VANTA|nr:2-acylglycerol O-acyltransferase 2-like [Vanessa tameamea]
MDIITSTEDLCPDSKTIQENILFDIIKEVCGDQNCVLSPKLAGKVRRIIADSDLSHYSSLHKLSTADESTSTLLGLMHKTDAELTFDEQAELNQAIINKIQNKIPILASDLDKLKQNIGSGKKTRKNEIKDLQESLDDKLNTLKEQENEKVELMVEWLNHRLQEVSSFSNNSTTLGIEWAPLHLPLARRLQTLAATTWICLILFGEAFCIFIYVQFLYSSYWWLALLYGAWLLNDLDVCNRGGRIVEWVRNWSLWRYYRDYFPINLVKTAELDTSKNYLFACFPHGVVCSGAFGAFATNALDFYKVFPGMTCNMITLGGHFRVPLFRELVLALGSCASSQESLLYLLDKNKNQGKCVVLFVGGAAEALDSHPGEYKVILSRRKGFVRVAMKSGAPLVPVFSFGETDVYRPLNNSEDSLLRKFQDKVRQITGISPVFPIGRGVFQYSFGVLPLRSPITTVVGVPMEIEKNLDPTSEEVDAVHAEFTRRLIDLFESEKSKYLTDHKNTHLVIT